MKKIKLVLITFMFVGVMVLMVSPVSAVALMGTPNVSPSEKSPETSGEKININTAGIDQLTQLPRIGPKIAQRIIDFRNKNGKFKRPDDLMKVKGIGEKTYQRFAHRLVVDGAKGTEKGLKGGERTEKKR